MTVISRCLAATAALALMTGAAAAATAVSQRDLNMRSGPGTGYAVVMTIPGGAPVEVLDCSGSWCRVAFGGREGYASRAYLGQGAAVVTDEEIDAFIRTKAESAYHPSCTCRMGSPDDPMTVVDPQTRVIGIEGLRVVDSSIMPSITTGNLNAPTIMIGEKAADLIIGRSPLAPSNAPRHVATNWQVAQR